MTEPSDQGRPGRGWAAFQLFLKTQSVSGSLHLPCLWSLLGRSFRSPRSWERGQAGSKAKVIPQGPGSCQVGSTGDMYLARPSSSSQHLHTSAIWCSQILTPGPLPNHSKENTGMPAPLSSQRGQSLSQGVPHAWRQVFEVWDHVSTSSSIAQHFPPGHQNPVQRPGYIIVLHRCCALDELVLDHMKDLEEKKRRGLEVT